MEKDRQIPVKDESGSTNRNLPSSAHGAWDHPWVRVPDPDLAYFVYDPSGRVRTLRLPSVQKTPKD